MVYRERWDTVLCGQHGFGASMASAISFVLGLLAMAEILLKKKAKTVFQMGKGRKMATVHTKATRTQF